MKIDSKSAVPLSLAELEPGRPWKIGKSDLAVYRHIPTGEWIGIVRYPNRTPVRFRNVTLDLLIEEMEEITTKPPPPIVGFAGASERFRYLYPGDFKNTAFEKGERGGKLDAGAVLKPILNEKMNDIEAVRLLRNARRILDKGGQSPLHMTEGLDLDAIWSSGKGSIFVHGLRAWCAGERAEAIDLLHRACEGRRSSWPMFTLYPALISPEKEAILRPTAAKKFALGVNSLFAKAYESQPSLTVYKGYLDLLDQTSEKIAHLEPRDYIDLASFVWVSTSYSADVKPRIY
jgi:hypothetical protein